MVGNTKYYKQINKDTGELIGYISYDIGEAPNDHPTVDHILITEEEFYEYIQSEMENAEEGAEADAE